VPTILVDSKSPGIKITPLKTFAGDKQFEVVFDGVKVPAANLVGPLDQGGKLLEKILEKAAICKCAEMVGGAQRVLDMAAEYAKEREQFGRPIGSFQAVQHHCSNMLMGIEGSRYVTYKVAWMLNENVPCAKLVSVAKAWVSGAETGGLSRADTFRGIWRLAHEAAGITVPELALDDAGSPVPRLSENWYCCAEPTCEQLVSF